MLNPRDVGMDEDAVTTSKRDDVAAPKQNNFLLLCSHMNFSFDLLRIQMAHVVMEWLDL